MSSKRNAARNEQQKARVNRKANIRQDYKKLALHPDSDIRSLIDKSPGLDKVTLLKGMVVQMQLEIWNLRRAVLEQGKQNGTDEEPDGADSGEELGEHSE